MLDRLRELVAHWRGITEAAALTDRDLDDLGLTRAQLAALATVPRDLADQMAQMAANFGITEAELKANLATYLELLATCDACRDRAACASARSKGDLARPSDCAFCPNAPRFVSLVD